MQIIAKRRAVLMAHLIGAEKDDVVTEGSSWVKWVDRIEIHRS